MYLSTDPVAEKLNERLRGRGWIQVECDKCILTSSSRNVYGDFIEASEAFLARKCLEENDRFGS
jgi:hypothetical protein